MIFKACALAWRDYWHEALLSACAILSLAAVLTPLLVLYGVKYGVVSTMTDRLRNDPRNLEVSPVSSGHFTPQMLTELAARKDVAFVQPRTRALAATMDVRHEGITDVTRWVTLSLEPTGPNDPLIQRHLRGIAAAQPPGTTFPVVLSSEAARKLDTKPGGNLTGKVERLKDGKVQSATVELWVKAVLPLEAQQKDVAFVPIALLEATEDFRDGRRPHQDIRLSEAKGWTGETRPTERVYPGFRLYAKTLEDVTTLREHFARQRVEVYTEAEQIAAVQSLDASLTLIFSLIGAAASLGFLASTASGAQAAVRRKERHLGIIRLMGFPARAVMAFPLFQGLITGFLGTTLASFLYLATAFIIDKLFAHSLHGVESICALPLPHLAAAFALVLGLSLAATLLPAARAARIEPSEVIRDV